MPPKKLLTGSAFPKPIQGVEGRHVGGIVHIRESASRLSPLTTLLRPRHAATGELHTPTPWTLLAVNVILTSEGKDDLKRQTQA